MRIKDLKIGTQLRYGLGLILLFIVLLGLVALRHINEMAGETSELYNHPLQVSWALGELQTDVHMMRIDFRNFLLAKGEQEKEQAKQSYAGYRMDALKQFDALYDRYLGNPVDIDSAKIALTKWDLLQAEVLNGQAPVRLALERTNPDGDIGRQRTILVNHIQTVKDFAHTRANMFLSSTIELKSSLTRQLILISVGILLVTLLVVVLLTRNIQQPLAVLEEAAVRFARGDIHMRSSYRSNNEFGKLSDSFNQLAQTIEEELLLNRQSAEIAGVMLKEEEARKFCHTLLQILMRHTEAQLGAVYLLNSERREFMRFESIGMDNAEVRNFSATSFEGEFGTALATGKIQLIKNLPADTAFSFPSTVGRFIPREMLTLPIVPGKETIAMVTLATMENFTPGSLRLLEAILSTLSARMDGVLAYRKITEFSRQLEKQNLELEAQKNELSSQASELTEQNMELEMQKRQLDEANKLKTVFLSNMSHELRTPLNSVIALAGVLNRRLEGKVAEEEYRYLEVIERNGKQLLALINDILDLSRIESGRDDIEISPFNINDLLNEIIGVLAPQAELKGLELRTSYDPDLPPVHSDYDKCRHILQNIVANAVKFTDEGRVEIHSSFRDDFLQISVSDTGIGIEKESLPFIFDEFRQVDSGNAKKYGGTGLGLAIAKKYADMLGGKISVSSTPGEGTQFIVILPFHFSGVSDMQMNVSSKTGGNEKPAGAVSYTYQPGNKTVLLVEDTEAAIIQMKDILAQQGYHIEVARNGAEALHSIAQKTPDAMILDLMMPGVDGFEVLKRIREQGGTSDLPVIILTAKYITREELSFLRSNNIKQLIRKGDVNKDLLLEAIARMLARENEIVPLPEMKPAVKNKAGTPVILVVEDNPDNMLTIKALLADKCTVLEADDGLKAINMAIDRHPDLILMDIALPGMNGIDAMQQIRKDKATENIPIIAVTASVMKGDRESLLKLGFNGYISKPIDHRNFSFVIQTWLGQQ